MKGKQAEHLVKQVALVMIEIGTTDWDSVLNMNIGRFELLVDALNERARAGKKTAKSLGE